MLVIARDIDSDSHIFAAAPARVAAPFADGSAIYLL
jgi:hypothetical protein